MKKFCSLWLAATLTLALPGVLPAFAKSKAEKETVQAAKVQAGIAKLGVGRDARVTVTLRDRTKLSGYVSRIGDDSFAVTDLKSGATTDVPYPAVAQVKGHNLSTGAIIAISVGVAVGVVLLILYLLVRNN